MTPLDPHFDPCVGHHGGEEFSVAAHDSIVDSKAAMYAKILRFLRERGDATCAEVEAALGMRHQTASARLAELKHSGRVFKTGARRKTDSGRYAAVLAVAEITNPYLKTEAEVAQ